MVKDWQALHLRGDVDELETLPGLVDADHREGAEDLHHRRALACDVGQQYGYVGVEVLKNSLPGWPFLSGGGREGLGWPNSLAAFDLRGLMLVSVRLQGLMNTGSCRNNKIDVFLRWKSHICVHFRCCICTEFL